MRDLSISRQQERAEGESKVADLQLQEHLGYVLFDWR